MFTDQALGLLCVPLEAFITGEVIGEGVFCFGYAFSRVAYFLMNSGYALIIASDCPSHM